MMDNNIEKMQGIRNGKSVRLSNDESSFIITPHFRGQSNDNELRPHVGDTWTRLKTMIDNQIKSLTHVNHTICTDLDS